MKQKNMILPLWRSFVLITVVLACFGRVPNALATDTEGALPFGNNADGVEVLTSLTSGVWNSGFGYQALNKDTAGGLNTATGLRALFNNTEGDFNTANGTMALFNNTTGDGNVAIGAQALVFNDTGFSNTAVGTQALFSNTSGFSNSAFGWGALASNGTFGNENTAIGYGALYRNTEGRDNTAIGWEALLGNINGVNNTALGVLALEGNGSGSSNTAIGTHALHLNTTGSFNIGLGASAGTGVVLADHVIAIGADGEDVSNSCYIGQIWGATSSGGTAVYINSLGKLGTINSSRRFKDDIKPMDHASKALFALRPVIFRYKKEIDPAGRSQFGLVAEDVEKVNPDLVVRDKEGKPYTVRYEQVNAMLLNEFLKEHRRVEEQARKVREQEATIAELKKDFRATVAQLTARLEEVSAQIEVSGPARKVVLSNP
jgi:trimeric autotransporter adhesin